MIANVSQSQASHYNCHLSNSFGDDNRTFFLRVIGMPSLHPAHTATISFTLLALHTLLPSLSHFSPCTHCYHLFLPSLYCTLIFTHTCIHIDSHILIHQHSHSCTPSLPPSLPHTHSLSHTLAYYSEPPNSPEEFGINEETSGGRSVGLEWIPPLSSDVQPLEGYLLQLTFTERDTVTSSIVSSL